jgi:hypothetical protein
MLELPELPTIKDATVDTLRLEGTLAKRLPSMPSGELNDLYFSDVRRREAEQYAAAIGAAFDISRRQLAVSRANARATGRATQRAAERSLPQAGNNMSKTQSRSVRSKKSTVLRNARDVLGMGTDLYK